MGNTPDKRNCLREGEEPQRGQNGDDMNRQIYYHKAGKWFSPELFGGQLKKLVAEVKKVRKKKECCSFA